MQTEEPTDTSFRSLVPQAWYEDTAIIGAVIRGYSSGIAEFPEANELALAAVRSFLPFNDGRFMIGFGEIPHETPQQVFEQVVTFHGDEIRMNLNVRKGSIPAGHYAFLVLPRYDESEAYINRRTESVRGLLTLVAGHTAMLDLVFEQYLDFSAPGNIARASKVVESHVHPLMWQVFDPESLRLAEVALQKCTSDLKPRAELAFSFISRSTNALDPATRYANTWMALEVVGGGHKAVRTFLNGLDPAFGAEAKRFFDMRNALFHHGQRPAFEQSDERFLCACILAMILQQLEIHDKGFENLVKEHLGDKAKAKLC